MSAENHLAYVIQKYELTGVNGGLLVSADKAECDAYEAVDNQMAIHNTDAASTLDQLRSLGFWIKSTG